MVTFDTSERETREVQHRISDASSTSKSQEFSNITSGIHEDHEAWQRHHRAVFADANEMKAKLRDQLTKPEYNVAQFYHQTGHAQRLAKHPLFEQITLAMIVLNALWIFIDTDYNPAEVLAKAPPFFQIVEQLFCFYFVGEWVIRFCAFKKKLNGLRDGWFIFDALMCLMFVIDSWIMYLYMVISGMSASGGMGNASILRIARLLRLSRMARMVRLLRVMPELLILIKGMGAAMRSVGFTLILLLVLLYVFGIAFKQLCNDENERLCNYFFPSVPRAMHTLLVHGTLMDNLRELVIPLEAYGMAHLLFFYVFVLLAALTVMNMLIGVLCDVVNTTASIEKESLAVTYVKDRLSSIMKRAGMSQFLDLESRINKEEFLTILENREAAGVLGEVGVDVVGLVDFADFIFKDDISELHESEVKMLSFADFVEVVLKLRGNNNATVRDIVDLRKFVQLKVSTLDAKMDSMVARSRRTTSIGMGNGRRSQSSGRSRASTEPALSQKIAPLMMEEKVCFRGSKRSAATLSDTSARDSDEPQDFEERPRGRVPAKEKCPELVSEPSYNFASEATVQNVQFETASDVGTIPDPEDNNLFLDALGPESPSGLVSPERKDGAQSSDFRRLVERLVLEHESAIATLQRANQRLQTELDILKSSPQTSPSLGPSAAQGGFSIPFVPLEKEPLGLGSLHGVAASSAVAGAKNSSDSVQEANRYIAKFGHSTQMQAAMRGTMRSKVGTSTSPNQGGLLLHDLDVDNNNLQEVSSFIDRFGVSAQGEAAVELNPSVDHTLNGCPDIGLTVTPSSLAKVEQVSVPVIMPSDPPASPRGIGDPGNARFVSLPSSCEQLPKRSM